ncbi:MAG: globin [Bacteroidetes bacterium MedPE-SWsnd-G2]|nr:MAG: globin [Bacteroidetes bacterium MedPE-SWsnd-G2]
MELKDIESREDVSELVHTFYEQVRNDAVLGPFFNETIKDWESHLEKLVSFWDSSLFLKSKYFGNPLEAHVNLDKAVNHTITEKHFGLWLNLWFKTIDDLFVGEHANMAKNRARKMSTFLFLKMFESRSKG